MNKLKKLSLILSGLLWFGAVTYCAISPNSNFFVYRNFWDRITYLGDFTFIAILYTIGFIGTVYMTISLYDLIGVIMKGKDMI